MPAGKAARRGMSAGNPGTMTVPRRQVTLAAALAPAAAAAPTAAPAASDQLAKPDPEPLLPAKARAGRAFPGACEW